jgi:hypothetical protein
MSTSHYPSFDLVPSDMKDAIARFHSEAKQIIDSFLTTLESYQPPPIVYHYTNDAGLRGILQSGRIWLTDIFALNDPSELRHGLSRATIILSEKAANGPPESKLFATDFAALNKALNQSAHYFVCSFSEAGDDLGQWRAYADNGRGYALGFSTQALEAAFGKGSQSPTSNNAAFPITYDDSTLDGIQRQLVERMFSLISLPRGRNLSQDALGAYMVELSVALAANALHAGLFFKHEAYSNEKEYRFLEVHRADAAPAIKLRSRPYSLIRYREFDWKAADAAALRRIVIGPAADRETGRRFAEDCLREFVRGEVEIVSSLIPYRTG